MSGLLGDVIEATVPDLLRGIAELMDELALRMECRGQAQAADRFSEAAEQARALAKAESMQGEAH